MLLCSIKGSVKRTEAIDSKCKQLVLFLNMMMNNDEILGIATMINSNTKTKTTKNEDSYHLAPVGKQHVKFLRKKKRYKKKGLYRTYG